MTLKAPTETVPEFLNDLASVGIESVFNPYRDRCSQHDYEDGPELRRKTLSVILHAAAAAGRRGDLEALWVGRDLGHRGGRRTGLAFTDDPNLRAHVRRWDQDVPIQYAVTGKTVTEPTARVIWKALEVIPEKVFLWNVFPFHPHIKGYPFTNRQHTAIERAIGEVFLERLIRLLSPHRLIAVGRNAEASLAKVAGGRPVHHVRHPSYGGVRDFRDAIAVLYPSMSAFLQSQPTLL